MSKIGYATYIRHRLSGFELGDVPRATPADLDAYPRFRDRLAQQGGSARYLRPICRGPITYEHTEPLARDLVPSEGSDRRAADRRRVHERAVTRDHRPVSAQRVLRDAGGVPRRDRRGDEGRVRDDRRRRRPAADRRARPCHGPPHHVPRPLRRRVRGQRRAPCRRDQRRAPRRPRRPGAPAPVLGQLRGAAPPRHRPGAGSSARSCGQAGHDPVRGGQPAPRPRVRGVARGGDPRGQGPGAGRDRLHHQLHRASRAGRPAPRAVHGHRRAPSG